jgi:hypothetical protein
MAYPLHAKDRESPPEPRPTSTITRLPEGEDDARFARPDPGVDDGSTLRVPKTSSVRVTNFLITAWWRGSAASLLGFGPEVIDVGALGEDDRLCCCD